MIELDSALGLAVRLAASCHALVALEQLRALESFRPGGPLARRVVRQFRPSSLSGDRDRALIPMLAMQAASSVIVVILGPHYRVGRVCLVISLVVQVYVQRRRRLGGDGAEQMATLVTLAGAIAFIPQLDIAIGRAAAWFIASQVALSYSTAGIAKLVSPRWRSTNVLSQILATHRYGSPNIAAVLSLRPSTALFLQWCVILFEITFPVAFALPIRGMYFYLLVGMMFHLVNAVTMGLNTFTFAFAATYPCVVYTWWTIHPN